MRTSRQTAHALVRAVAAIGLIELLTNPDDRRLVQVRLTPLGRAALADWQAGEALWVITLLNGLDTHAIRATTHILYVIRQRLARNERELSRPGRARAPRHHRSGRPNVYSRNP
jgi:DNA-binding MarR family transcriptional regulator